jgi:hypothetical protein
LLKVALITLALNACGSVQEMPRSEVNIKATSETAIKINRKLAAKKTGLKTITSPNRPKQKKIYPAISHLNGMNRKEIIDLLGQPRFQRQDNPALIWQYQTEFCALDIFFYSLEKESKFQVNHFETRSKSEGQVEKKVCFISLLKAHEKSSAS